MKRRTFIQSTFGAIAGILPLSLLGISQGPSDTVKIKAGKRQHDLIVDDYRATKGPWVCRCADCENAIETNTWLNINRKGWVVCNECHET